MRPHNLEKVRTLLRDRDQSMRVALRPHRHPGPETAHDNHRSAFAKFAGLAVFHHASNRTEAIQPDAQPIPFEQQTGEYLEG
jgi:hypothetical protein